eukprot:CAMPEP_0184516478 /NCGR_PEP_ID=MMETSP0198_2-20121128/5053_1 /TAXON_ID=1112570 /ORGANISM="Thraustochytrium sp., Strain LLF1b" /LENGTH=354 /DNA_ID=CAMNT_0026906807 /DNA_START=318 /DNA_END=1378 /DNA_ORIENTATION=+
MDHTRADKVRAHVETMNTMSGFLFRPMVGSFIDAYGRRAGLVGGPALAALARLLVVKFPTNTNYIIYRFVNLLSMIPLMQAFSATLSDKLGGRGSKEYARVSKATSMLLALVRSVSLMLTSRVRNSRQRFLLAGAFNVMASATFYLFVGESLGKAERRPLKLVKAANPFAFLPFFAQSSKLRALALFTLARSAPEYNGTTGYYRRKRFHWKLQDEARVQQIGNFAEVVGPLVSLPLMERIGRRRTAICLQTARAVVNLNTAFTPDSRTLLCNPVLLALFDSTCTDRLDHEAASSVDAGSGELSSNLMNLRFPLGMVLPNLFSSMFSSPILDGASPFVLCAALHLLNASVSVPLA